MSEPKKKNHHTNPKFAISGFSKNGVLRKMDRNSKVGQSGIKTATVDEYFYTIFGSEKPDHIEDSMASQFEAHAAPIFREIIENHKIPLDDYSNSVLSNFLTLQILRSPAFRSTFVEGMIGVFDLSLALSDNSSYLMTPQKRKEIEKWHMIRWWNTDGPVLADIFFKMTKVLVIFAEDCLLTSNQPISMLFRSSSILTENEKGELVSEPYVSPYGNLIESDAVFYSLSRRVGLIALPPYHPELNGTIITGDQNLALIFNSFASMFVDEIFFHPDDLDYITANLPGAFDSEDASLVLDLIDLINPTPWDE